MMLKFRREIHQVQNIERKAVQTGCCSFISRWSATSFYLSPVTKMGAQLSAMPTDGVDSYIFSMGLRGYGPQRHLPAIFGCCYLRRYWWMFKGIKKLFIGLIMHFALLLGHFLGFPSFLAVSKKDSPHFWTKDYVINRLLLVFFLWCVPRIEIPRDPWVPIKST